MIKFTKPSPVNCHDGQRAAADAIDAAKFGGVVNPAAHAAGLGVIRTNSFRPVRRSADEKRLVGATVTRRGVEGYVVSLAPGAGRVWVMWPDQTFTDESAALVGGAR